jgi:hypothetical protein
MNIDIDRLHDVIERKLVGRGVGNTTAMIIQAVQSADLHSFIGPKSGRYAVIAANDFMSRYQAELAFNIAISMRMFPTFLKETRRLVFDKGLFQSDVIFLSRSNLSEKLRGHRLMNYYIESDIYPSLTFDEINFLETRIERE